MKTRVKLSFHLILTLAVMLTMAQGAWAAITGSGTADDPYLISSAEDWNTFANNVNNGTSYSGQTVKLNADISVTTMVGTYDNPFNGTFDGDGHTLTVALNNDGQSGDGDQNYGVAPFRFTNGATIKYLHVAGTITTSTRKYAAGLIGMTKSNTNTIKNCISSVEIYSTISGDGTHGGFIGKASGTVNITNCLFNGQLTTTNSNTTTSCGGFVGWKDGTLTITNCLYAPATTIPSGKIAVSSESSSTFSRNNVTPTNSYYTQTLGVAQGDEVGSKTAAQLATALGGGWKVSSNKAVPILSVASITISSTTEWNNFSTRVNNGEDEINVTLTKSITVSSMVGTDEHPFCGTFDGGTNTITADITGTTEAAALFRYISGATIKRLTVAGSISGGIHCAGLVGYAADNSNNLIEKVTVRAAITTNGTHCGGIIGHGKKSTTTIKDCIFSGSISGGTHVGVLWGWSDSNCKPTIQNCLENGSSYTGTNVNPVGLISNWGTVTNTYYLHTTKGNPNQNTTRGIRLYSTALSEGVYGTLTAIDHQTYYAPVTISNIEETYSITGKAIFPEPIVTAADGTILTKGIHYNVAYSSSNDKTIGDYSLTVTGISPYAGSQTINYSVIAATLTDTWYIDGGMNGGSQCDYSNTDKVADVSSNGKTMHFKWTNGAEHTFYWSTWGMGGVAFDNPSSNQLVITFPDIKGIVSKVYFSKMVFRPSSVKMYIGNSKGRLSVANGDGYLEGHESGVPFSATLTGSVEVDENDPLKIWFEGEEVLSVDCPEATLNLMSQNQSPCNVKVTYTTTEIELGPEHTFSFPDPSTFSGNTLTLTCTNNDNDHECGLANRQAVLTLDMKDGKTGAANTATLNISDFIKQTGLTCSNGAITYYNHTKNQSYAFASWQGDYTVSVTVTVDGKQYTLTKDIQVVDPHHITNDCLALSIDKYMSEAWKDDKVTITYKPQTGMILSELTVKATTDLTIGHGITDNQDNTYTFVMPDEDVTIIPTFSFNIDENDFSQEGDTYTIKSAEGWGDFATLITYDETLNGFSGKTVKLGTSIESSEMAGTSGHPFKGTFDGQGNTLTFNLQASEGYSAPFHYTDGATISNLHVTGLIEGNDISPLAGLVGKATGNLTISNCHVSTKISTTHSGAAWHGGIIAFWDDSNVKCTITGCVYDGLIYNPNVANATYYCFGFIGNSYGSNMDITFTDCLFAPAEYGTGEYALDDDGYTFVYPKSGLIFHVTNCYYTRNLGRRQGRPATTAITAPANLGNATTDHGMVDGYENGFLYNGNYYTPKYGDAVVEYRFNDWNERADVTINGTGENLVGVNITEEVGNIKSVTYNRPFNTAQAATVILPFCYICNGSEGGKFYSFAGISVMAPIVEDGNHVTSLTANTPYLFVPTAKTMTFPNISSMTGGVVTLLPTTGDHKVTLDGGNWTLVGSYSIKTWVTEDLEIDKAYFINDEGKLEKIVSGMITAPTECYLLTVIDAKDIAQATVTGMKSLYSHTGSAISLGYTVTAYNSSTPLTKGTDFTETITKGGTTVTNAIDEGNYTLTITGKSPYFGSQSFDFTVGDYIPMTNTTTVMNNCLYGVKENITISDRIVVIGDVTLTLEEGYTLTAQHGIEVEAGNKLTIDGTGSLTIPTGGNYCAGIGSNNGKEYGHIIINGGIITTQGGDYGAGIGGGYENVDNGNCSITINGGVINATGDANAAGIGGGYGGAHNNNPRGAAGTIIINGGQVTASYKTFSGSETYCGIGHGYKYSGGGGSLTLDWTRESDFINCYKYNITNINFGGKDFVLDEDNTVTATISNIDGKKIIPKLDNLVLNHATMNNLCSLYRYTGSEIALGYTIKSTDGTTTLVKGTDYSETIKKGDETVTMVKDKGEYTLTITGLGDYYTGTKLYTFSVADIDEDLTQDGSEYYVNFPADGSTKTINLSKNQTIKVYDSEGKNGSLVTCDGYLLLQAPDGYALEVMGKTDAMKYNEVNSLWVNSLSAYEGDNTSNEIINLQTNSDNILFASGGKVMLMRLNVPALYTFASQYGLDLTVRVIPQQSYTITKGTVSNGSIDIADNKTTANTNEMITLTVNPAEGYLLKRITITDTDGGSTIQTIGEDQWYSGENTVSFKMPSRNVTITPEFTNSLTAAGGLSMNIDLSGTKECVIPEIVQSFNIRASAVDNPNEGSSATIILKAHNEYCLQATGQIEFANVSTDDGEISIYDGANTSATLLTNIKGASKDKVSIGTQTSSSNYMTIDLSEEDIYNSVFTGTIETQIKNYSITYDLAGGSVATDNPTTYNYKTDAFTLTNPTREGYEFAGWTGTELDAASTSVTIATGSTGNRKYTATWTPITYNITYTNAVNGTDGVTNTNPTTYTIESEAITLADPSKTGYVFAGWFSDAEFNTPATTTIAANSTGDKTFWAKWTRLITSEGITISIPSQEWTGNALTPVITVTDGTTTLNEGTDYTVTAPSGTIQDVGDYTYTITGVGNYSGETTATFTITPKTVTIKLTEEYGTYCCPNQDLDFSEATGLTAYIAAGYNKSKGTLLMVKVTSVPAGTGLLLKGTAGSTYTAKGQTSPYVYSNLLTGTIAETDVTTNDLILGKSEIDNAIGFYRVREPGKLAAGKAYLKDMAPAAGAPMLNLEFYDDATGIADVRSKMSDAVTEDWYTLDGRKLQGRPTKKGLYLLNGKKVVVR